MVSRDAEAAGGPVGAVSNLIPAPSQHATMDCEDNPWDSFEASLSRIVWLAPTRARLSEPAATILPGMHGIPLPGDERPAQNDHRHRTFYLPAEVCTSPGQVEPTGPVTGAPRASNYGLEAPQSMPDSHKVAASHELNLPSDLALNRRSGAHGYCLQAP